MVRGWLDKGCGDLRRFDVLSRGIVFEDWRYGVSFKLVFKGFVKLLLMIKLVACNIGVWSV
jgi:hypothetical protein